MSPGPFLLLLLLQLDKSPKRLAAAIALWMGSADIGAAPVFMPPFSWWFARRTRVVAALLGRCAARHDVRFVAFHEDRLSASDRGRYFAHDGIHPSAASYRHCYRVLKHETALPEWLAAR